MKLLETRESTLVILNDDEKVEEVPKTAYYWLKLSVFDGKYMVWNMPSGPMMYEIPGHGHSSGILICWNDGLEYQLTDTSSPVITRPYDIWQMISNAIFGNDKAILETLETCHTLAFIGVKVVAENMQAEPVIDREGRLHVPFTADLTTRGYTTYHDGSKVAKIVLQNMGHLREHQLVGLMGKDEIGQYWMHFLPPDYIDKTFADCEVWLAGGEPGDTVIFSPEWQGVNECRYTDRATSSSDRQ